MKIKSILAAILCAVFCLSSLTACSDAKDTEKLQSSETATANTVVEKIHKLYVRAPKGTVGMTAAFLNTATGETEEIEMEQSGEDGNSVLFSCEADVTLYNMVHVICGGTESMDVAFNRFVSGWDLRGDELLPYIEGEEPKYDPQFETIDFSFDGHEKKVYIWTPEDYDEKSEEPYSVIYMFDGQSILVTGKERGMDNDTVCWNVSEHIASMMEETDYKAIVVGIDNNDVYRWDELVPDLGAINMEEGSSEIAEEDVSLKRGSAFADYVCDTVMPYVNERYNVYTDAQHTALAGSSLGGLETFYAVLSHPDQFGTGGVMSATFDMYAEEEWTAFLSDKTDMKNAPLLYFYAGGYATDNGDVSETMYNKLIESGYPKDKLVFSKYEPGEHMIEYWRNIYPEFLEAVFTGDVAALAFGVPVQYEDKSDPLEEMLEEIEIEYKDVAPGYIYFDNSETKWEKVYVYWWGGMAINGFTKDTYYFAEWPGFEMERIEESDVYRIAAPFGINGGIIFDSGVTDKEVAEGKEAFQTVDLPYSADLIGKIFKINLSVEPTPDDGAMKTKYRYSDGDWSDYMQSK